MNSPVHESLDALRAELAQQTERLRGTEEKLRLVVSHLSGSMFTQDLDLRYTWVVNPAAPLTVSDVVGHTDFDLFSAEEAEHMTAIKREVLERGAAATFDLPAVLGGEHRYFEAVLEPLRGTAGSTIGIFGRAREVSDFKRTERAMLTQLAQISTIFDSMNALVYVADMQTFELLFVNAYGLELFGSDSIGHRCFEALQAGQQTQCSFCTNHEIVKDGTAQAPYLWEFKNTLTGRWFLCMDKAIPWTDGRLVRMEIAVDISDRKRAEEFRGEYIRLISHDLRNPLNVVNGLALMLQETLGAAQMPSEAKSAAIIARNADRMRFMIEDLLESARFEDGQVHLEKEPIDLAQLVRDVVESASTSGERSRVHIALPDTNIPAVSADRQKLERAVVNLLINALKYSPETAPVTIELTPAVEGAVIKGVDIVVRDLGHGIGPEHLPHVFDRYFRVPADAKTTTGLGLGLYITRKIVEAHGGYVTAASEPGIGSTFRLHLPALSIAAADFRPDAAAAAHVPHSM